MNPVDELLKNAYQAGSEAYYQTLFLKKDKQQQQLLLLLQKTLENILYCSEDPAVRSVKFLWWIDELKNTPVATTSCLRHPVSKAINFESVSPTLLKNLIHDISTLSQSGHVSENAAINRWQWLINAISPKTSPETADSIAYVLFNFQNLQNIEKDFAYNYQTIARSPKYLSHKHITDKQSDVIDTYILNEIQLIESHITKLKGQKITPLILTKLVIIEKSLNKIKKQPNSIYNNEPILNPFRLLIICYFARNKQVF